MPAVSIDPPYTVAELPSCVNRNPSRHLVSDVYGGIPGTRKRKRAELVIGIAGESINLYDTSSSRLITSYALPPQSSLSCPPCSIRLRKAGKTSFERRTYISMTGDSTNITLFKTTEDVKPGETTIKYDLSRPENKVIFIGIVPEGGQDNLLLVREDGEVQCLEGQNLTPLWTSSAATEDRDHLGHGVQHDTVEMCRLTDSQSLKHSLFKERPDILTIVDERALELANILLFAASRVNEPLKDKRTLRVLLLPQQRQSIAYQSRTLQNLMTIDIPWVHDRAFEVALPIKYDFHAGSGSLYELVGSKLSIFALNDSLAKLKSQLLLGDRPSFKRLSSISIATSSSDSIAIWNPRFNSVQAVLSLTEGAVGQHGKKRNLLDASEEAYELVSLSPKNNQVHAIKDGILVAFGTNLRQERSGRRRPTGLLIDSLGCGTSTAKDDDQHTRDRKTAMDRAVTAQDVAKFEAEVARSFGLARDDRKPKEQRSSVNIERRSREAHSADVDEQSGVVDGPAAMSWIWPSELLTYPGISESWLAYLLRKIFSWESHPNKSSKDGSVDSETLDIEFFPYNVVRWLIEGGRLTVATIESVFRQELMASNHTHLPAGCLVAAVVAMDPEMRLLLLLLSNTYLGAHELIHATRILMESFDLWEAPTADNRLALTEGEYENGDVEEEIKRLVEDTAEELQLAEFQLGEDNSTRGQALSLALLKLHRSASRTIVDALQSELTSNEIISLMYLLRFELARGSWTSRYLDVDHSSDDTPSQERNILLISDLLNNCVDAVGTGGWLSGDATLNRNDHQNSEELISSLKLEVSAALEGIQEAQYLRGLTTEMMRYSQAVQGGLPEGKKRKVDTTVATKLDLVRRNNVPMLIEPAGNNPALLPYGLKVEQQISLLRVGAGGELSRRSMRDIGRLKSKKVGQYSLERIVV